MLHRTARLGKTLLVFAARKFKVFVVQFSLSPLTIDVISVKSTVDRAQTLFIVSRDILAIFMERGRLNASLWVPYEATAGLAMLLLRDYGIVTVHFAGVSLGTSALMFKFIPPRKC